MLEGGWQNRGLMAPVPPPGPKPGQLSGQAGALWPEEGRLELPPHLPWECPCLRRGAIEVGAHLDTQTLCNPPALPCTSGSWVGTLPGAQNQAELEQDGEVVAEGEGDAGPC